ncbi:MAG: hypothetical protein GY711_28035 [bacterium]|nr:hypothetical protein [bacterium]
MQRKLRSLVFLGSFTLCLGHVSADTFTTAAAGNWTSGATWVGGVAPATDVDGDEILITHDVTVVNSNIKLIGGASFVATDVSFTMLNGNFVVEHGSAGFVGCQVLIEHGFSIQITTTAGTLSMVGCEVDVGQNFQNSEGVRYLEDVCLIVDENFQNAKGTDTLINVCALIGNSTSGNFQNDSDSLMHIEDSEFHLPNGNFQNQSSATLSGSITAIWLENGNLQNAGTWTAQVENYCVSGDVSGLSGFLPAAQGCADISAFFDPCNCDPRFEPVCLGTSGCPCGNNVGDGEGGCANSTGTGATLSASGSTSTAIDDLVLTASNLPADVFALLLAAQGAEMQLPLGDGNLCIGGPGLKIVRYLPATNSGPAGQVTLGPGIVALSCSGPLGDPEVTCIDPGETWYFQTWYRDLGGPCGGGVNTSSALGVLFH